MAKITILGSGGFGLSLAVMCVNGGHDVTVWSKFRDEIDTIKRSGELRSKLPGVMIPKEVKLTTDISDVKGSDIVILGIPTRFCREVCEEAKPFVSRESIIVNTAKGLEPESLKLMSEVTDESFPDNRTAILSGPSHAEEIGRGIPTTVVVASEDREVSYYVQNALSSVFGDIGPSFITVSMILFAFTTLLGNLYYVDNALVFLNNNTPLSSDFKRVFRLECLGIIFLGDYRLAVLGVAYKTEGLSHACGCGGNVEPYRRR